jgi:hypothetical protein
MLLLTIVIIIGIIILLSLFINLLLTDCPVFIFTGRSHDTFHEFLILGDLI